VTEESVAHAIGRLADEFQRFNDRLDAADKRPRPDPLKVFEKVVPLAAPFLKGATDLLGPKSKD